MYLYVHVAEYVLHWLPNRRNLPVIVMTMLYQHLSLTCIALPGRLCGKFCQQVLRHSLQRDRQGKLWHLLPSLQTTRVCGPS